ncbi:MAG TPA: ferrochelatase [Patescibacteria group bacterium]|nr:ferrochelatase [Patescibacteria group bacterium]
MKTAVVLFNLGGPLQRADIKPFLFNFFMDKNIVGAPLPIRYLIAKYISRTRGEGAALEAYGRLGYKSPLLQNTQAQAMALEAALDARMPNVGDRVQVFVSMRYWEPTAADTVDALESYQPDRLVMLPLYPEYSTTTTKSSFENFWREVQAADGDLHRRWDDIDIRRIPCYPLDAGFIEASAQLISSARQQAPANTRILFSAHGLPEKVIAKGDPYQFHCEQNAAAIAARLGLTQGEWAICYQSRIGPLKWIGPSVREEIARAAKDKVGVLIYPHAFVSEHVETLVELDEEFRKEAEHLGVPYYGRVPTVSTHPAFINGLADLVINALQGKAQPRPCGTRFSKCGCREAA